MCSSPRLLAAYHGLLRTAAPRHPPWTLSRLTIFPLVPHKPVARLRSTGPQGSADLCLRSTPPEPVGGLLPLDANLTNLSPLGQRKVGALPQSLAAYPRHHGSRTRIPFPGRCQRPRAARYQIAPHSPKPWDQRSTRCQSIPPQLEVWGLEPQTYGLQSHRSSR